MKRRTGLPATVTRGLVAGLAGTAAMTLYQEAVARARGRSALAENLREPRTWAEAPAPAQLAKKVSEGVLHQRVVKRQAPLITNAMHWAYGVSLGIAYGLTVSRLRVPALASGAAFGTAVWGVAYGMLSPLGIYEAPWRYPAKTLGIDLSYHLVYGVGVAAVYDALD
jgi:uncharacterized membrane protein YagU involved in acid resistance